MTPTSRPRLAVLLTVLAALPLLLPTAPTEAQDSTVPAQPTGLAAEAAHDAVTLDWDDPSDPTITHYQVLRRDRDIHEVGEFVTIEENTGSAATRYIDRTVKPERRYAYRVQAVNGHGVGQSSSFTRADTPAAPAPGRVPDPAPTPNGVRASDQEADTTPPVFASASASASASAGKGSCLPRSGASRHVAARARPVIGVPQKPREPGRSGFDFPGRRSVYGRAMDPTLSCEPLLPTLIETYLARCAVEGKSPRTIHAYRETLARFSRCLQEDAAPLDPDRLRPDHVIAYLARFAAHRPATRHRYFREVRCFFRWLRAAGYTDNDPFRGLRNVRLPRKIVPPLAPAEIGRLLACCDPQTVGGRRDRALLLTLLDTGIRCAEAVQLDLADCDFASRRLHVRHGKGDKARIVPFAARCAGTLTGYCADRGRPRAPSSSRPATRASTRGCACVPTDSSNCCGASAAPSASPKCTRIASAIRSPPGPSPTTRASSMSSTCSATARRR